MGNFDVLDCSAGSADGMMVMWPADDELVVCMAVLEIRAFDEPRLFQGLKRPVERHCIESESLFEGIYRYRMRFFRKGFEHPDASRCCSQTVLAQKRSEIHTPSVL